MKRQQLRRLLLLLSLLLFPVTLYYFSPVLILSAGMEGVINGSFAVFCAMLLFSPLLGRLFCGWLCPAGGLQECLSSIQVRKSRQGWRNRIKYGIWAVLLAAAAFCYLTGARPLRFNFFYETEQGLSVTGIMSYVIYYGILLLILVPSLLGGNRTFCHSLCWMAPFMVAGRAAGRLVHLPSLHIAADSGRCNGCRSCTRACPMSIDVAGNVGGGSVGSSECILCGACVDSCPQSTLRYRMKGEV